MTIKPATKAIILARVSTAEQAEDGRYSLPAQLRTLREYVNKGGKFGSLKEVIDEYTFDESASKGTRKKFQEALKIVKNSNEPIAIVVDKVDRFQRGFKETVEYDELRKEGKVELHFVSQGLVLHRNSPPHEILMWDAFVMFARSYVLQLSANVKRSIKEKLERGEFPGYVPTGYLNVKEQSRENPRTFVKKIIIDDERTPFIKRAFELYATGKYSLNKLTEIMREAGLKQKGKRQRIGDKLVVTNDRPITQATLYSILNNPFYTGEFLWRDPETGERKLYQGNYPALIDKKLFNAVQKVLKDYNTREKGFRRNRFKFQKLIRCAYCGCYLTAEEFTRTYKNKNAPRARQVYYHCTSGKALTDPDYYKRRFGTDKCPQDWWKEEEIEEAVLFQFEDIDYGEEIFEWMRKEIEKDYNERIEAINVQLKALKAELGQKEVLIKNYMDSIATERDEALKQEMRERWQELKKERDLLKEEIRILEDTKDIDTDEVIQNLSICFNLKKQYLSMEPEKQRELLLLCFRKIEAERKKTKFGRKKEKDFIGGKLYFQWNEPFRTLNLINWNEIIHQEKGEYLKDRNFSIEKDSEASLFP